MMDKATDVPVNKSRQPSRRGWRARAFRL